MKYLRFLISWTPLFLGIVPCFAQTAVHLPLDFGLDGPTLESAMELDFTSDSTSTAIVSPPVFAETTSSGSTSPRPMVRITEPLPNVYWQPAQPSPILPVSATEATYYGNNSDYGSVTGGTPAFYLTQAPFSPGTAPVYSPLNSASPVTNPPPTSPALDPYATPGGTPILGQPSPTTTTYGTQPESFSSDLNYTYTEMKRLLDRLSFEYYFAPKSGSTDLGINDFKLQSRFAFPCQHLGNTMVYVAPAVGMTLFRSDTLGNADAYAAWLDAGIEPRLNEQFRFDLWARLGVFSDFKKIDGNSIRLLGRGNVYVQLNSRTELVAGVIYLNRERVKMLPTGGLIWRPSDILECRLVFPDPKIARKLAQRNNTEWWGFVRADYGGNCWSFKTPLGDNQRLDYNDIRVSLGLEFRNPTTACADGYFEVGGLFDREFYGEGVRYASPSTSVYLGAGIYY